jgi:hypothetical protein
MTRIGRLIAIAALPLMLASCLLTPGKFTASLDIAPDRGFTFAYKGEVIALSGEMTKDQPPPDDQSLQDDDGEEQDAVFQQIRALRLAAPARGKAGGDEDFSGQGGKPDSAEDAAKMRAVAVALSKEYGFRSARYVGNRKFLIDYAISGRLDHAFLFPFNVDAQAIVPFVYVELRGADRLRIRAPGFANEKSQAGELGGMGSSMGANENSALDGTFTLTTAAAIVSQNQEDEPKLLPDGRRQIVWTATPATRDAPLAVLRVEPLAAVPAAGTARK